MWHRRKRKNKRHPATYVAIELELLTYSYEISMRRAISSPIWPSAARRGHIANLLIDSLQWRVTSPASMATTVGDASSNARNHQMRSSASGSIKAARRPSLLAQRTGPSSYRPLGRCEPRRAPSTQCPKCLKLERYAALAIARRTKPVAASSY